MAPQPNDIQLGPSGAETLLTPLGRTFTQGLNEISREERTASGRLVRDIVVTKKRFTIEYDLISHTNLEHIAGLYDLQDELSLIITYADMVETTYTVLLKPFDKERPKSVGAAYWTGVTLEMDEV